MYRKPLSATPSTGDHVDAGGEGVPRLTRSPSFHFLYVLNFVPGIFLWLGKQNRKNKREDRKKRKIKKKKISQKKKAANDTTSNTVKFTNYKKIIANRGGEKQKKHKQT